MFYQGTISWFEEPVRDCPSHEDDDNITSENCVANCPRRMHSRITCSRCLSCRSPLLWRTSCHMLWIIHTHTTFLRHMLAIHNAHMHALCACADSVWVTKINWICWRARRDDITSHIRLGYYNYSMCGARTKGKNSDGAKVENKLATAWAHTRAHTLRHTYERWWASAHRCGRLGWRRVSPRLSQMDWWHMRKNAIYEPETPRILP